MAVRTARLRSTIKRALFGSEDLTQQCAAARTDPQSEVTLWLRGLGAPRDVTSRHLMACGSPFLIGMGLDETAASMAASTRTLLLGIRHCSGEDLGTIALRYRLTIAVTGAQRLCLFEPRRTRNRCLPRPQLWARYLIYAWQRWRAPNSEVRLCAREVHAMIAFYLCPRPVALVSVQDANGVGNIFPMNLMGALEDGYFAFALTNGKPVTRHVERAGKIALSTIPADQASLAYKLAPNHRKARADWDLVPFATVPSPLLAFPVPHFALRVREMEITGSHSVGSHTLFIARTLHDERWAEAPQFCLVHGMYQSWQRRGNPVSAFTSAPPPRPAGQPTA